MELDGRTAIVTGGASGIGAAVAQALVAHGATVAIVDRDAGGAQRLAEELERLRAGAAFAVEADLADAAQAQGVVEVVRERTPGIDILVNSAGVMVFHPFDELPLEDWQRTLAINLTAPLLISQAAARQMPRGGAIVHISSIAGSFGVTGLAAYSASKGGLEALTRAMAVELADRGIRVNAVVPHAIETPMTAGVRDSENGARVLAGIPAGRFGDAGEVADAVAFLVGPRAAFITGTTMPIDGGSAIALLPR